MMAHHASLKWHGYMPHVGFCPYYSSSCPSVSQQYPIHFLASANSPFVPITAASSPPLHCNYPYIPVMYNSPYLPQTVPHQCCRSAYAVCTSLSSGAKRGAPILPKYFADQYFQQEKTVSYTKGDMQEQSCKAIFSAIMQYCLQCSKFEANGDFGRISCSSCYLRNVATKWHAQKLFCA